MTCPGTLSRNGLPWHILILIFFPNSSTLRFIHTEQENNFCGKLLNRQFFFYFVCGRWYFPKMATWYLSSHVFSRTLLLPYQDMEVNSPPLILSRLVTHVYPGECGKNYTILIWRLALRGWSIHLVDWNTHLWGLRLQCEQSGCLEEAQSSPCRETTGKGPEIHGERCFRWISSFAVPVLIPVWL